MNSNIFKIIKNNIFGIIIGGMLFGTIGVAATTYLYNSNQVSYNNDSSAVTDVKSAIDELYDNFNQGTATADNISLGKTAIVNGQLITGNGKDNINYSSVNPNKVMLAGSTNGGYRTLSLSVPKNSHYLISITVEGQYSTYGYGWANNISVPGTNNNPDHIFENWDSSNVHYFERQYLFKDVYLEKGQTISVYVHAQHGIMLLIDLNYKE